MKWVKDFFRFTKGNCKKLRIWSNLLKKHLMENINFRAALVFVKMKRVLLNSAPNSTQLHPPPPSSFQLPSSSTQLQPAHFSLHPALCNTLSVIRTKLSHVIGDFPKFKLKNSKVPILTDNWHTWYLGC